MTDNYTGSQELDADDTGNVDRKDSSELSKHRNSITRFLRFQLQNVPEMDISPFFAKRVSQLVHSNRDSFAILFQQVSRKLIPVFMMFPLVMGLLMYLVADDGVVATEQYADLFFDQPVQEDLSVAYVIDSLVEFSSEDTVP